ncbi:MAG: DNA-deoxyinosine glycosylase [Zetaproteobacteria bacterium CG_4_9_14_3_um_filter_49_83]|nr:MAG: DNA-deoxyinosine glycosylase [Zetaproteobacteria bacterium CG1_02_49_23]PIQ31565.1 MAG: DNA-deoxyinosine glycosylase [Zetaproteobacteria bacterium CG17_big_fil_post_rev_8_21_14_2_50_50_13]PIV29812.1 MAG: DNA-deoxyinosine glycosylase [Zetaproteobacteria bacterium CG02_land_8_20_14_3_00_50_9]PIY54678.1 MAG: DNA-deoxyinosine glycosylase [Zetaproteobacteria bacterium CG_4_10_14_0_8_um_filter_49_80]PJA35715.1 MAG: DNA-deoxyinosine glycosylase [Zetaproteobacteria bacterium CG_4_9_14_3_um_filt
MMHTTGFACSADADARLLILGSMPGRKSLMEAQYYAHPGNTFWPIMGELFDFDAALDYQQRLACLRQAGVALWDVAYSCQRPGSLDASINMQTVIANDFTGFFQAQPQIQAVFFNGRKAAELYCRLVVPALPEPWKSLACMTLPSTSPAHASLRMADKLKQWMQIRSAMHAR